MAKRIELLAPAGGMEQVKAAVRFGANAVYGGMKNYGLRAFAGNFDLQQLQEAVDYVHAHNARFYVTLNILPADQDMPGFLNAARKALSAGVDGSIVSDIGGALLIHQQVP